ELTKAGDLPGPHQVTYPQPSRPYLLIALSVILLLSVFAVSFVWFNGQYIYSTKRSKYTQLTDNGQLTCAAVSPDGTFIVYSQKEASGESLWVRYTRSEGQTQILPPQPGEFLGLAVSPDGHWAYYSLFSENEAYGSLMRASVAGGEPESLSGIDTDAAISF